MVELKLAAAPITWGICELPGWGEMLPSSRVLAEIASVGLTATEVGPMGFLPEDPDGVRAMLAEHGLRAVGGFVPVVMHDRAEVRDAVAGARVVADRLGAIDADVFVSAAVVDRSWGPPRPLDGEEWKCLFEMLDTLDEIAAEAGLRHVLHPHVGTLVEVGADVDRVRDGSDVRWCLDTGHLAIGGVDPVTFAQEAGDRVGHVHLKDVDMAIASQVRSGELTLLTAVQRGLFRPLGRGDLAIDEVVGHLEGSRYEGWYVLEQDVTVPPGNVPPAGTGPVDGVRESIEYLRLHVANASQRVPGRSSGAEQDPKGVTFR